ncbi:glycosyl hydrolase [Rhodococcoides trifolii]|uniref:Exo-alpha-(1->6)-L-arabinopyranosidase n=1 Tax=Rhodococcoides trifolii TaxID=908250 RepID=A0A917LHP9_9NOCA|nr:glycoside hydrolase family 3 C-terminal domain-containing protein [Rhodococcus trifolii]GGG24322.1 glycosyl hydrolase [Rhodococcus trifolii]
MGLDNTQKASLMSGGDFWHSQATSDLPAIMLTDGPHGIRKQAEGADALGLGDSVPATCFPPAVALGSSWDVELAERVGTALGAEARAAQVSVLLGPGVNIKRSPLCGRNFEYFSEDPVVSGHLGAAWVTGVQSHGVGTSVKHFAANNQETDRLRVSADVDERTLREIYLPAFEHIVRHANPTTIMCSYNKINGVYASENRWLLTELLRDEWGFDGLVVSDWGAVNDRVSALIAGLDLEMPPTGADSAILEALDSGGLHTATLDRAVDRVVALVERTRPLSDNGIDIDIEPVDVDAHHDLAREAAAASAVLLKNDDAVLPLADTSSIAVIGEFARTPRYQGAGSSQVVPTRLDAALDAITAIAPRVTFSPGFTLDSVPNPSLVSDAVSAAADAEVAVLFLGLPAEAESEGYDRPDIDLPADQLAILSAVHDVNPNVVVVLSNGGVVGVAGWQDQATAILEGWLLGQAGGRATAEILFGLTNPSGRLTETIPLTLQDNPSHLFFPGADQHVRYGEGIYVGYRYYDTLDRPVAYPFGFGLSYTTFAVADLEVQSSGINRVDVTAAVTNTGTRAGSEVVQVYVRDTHSRVDRPARELRAFDKVHLEPGESTTVTLTLDENAFRYWSPGHHRWAVDPGDVEIEVTIGSSDARLRATTSLDGDGVVDPLTAMSTLDEWFAHPVGSEVLAKVLSDSGARLDDQMRRLIGSMPIVKLASFGMGLSKDTLSEMLSAVAT